MCSYANTFAHTYTHKLYARTKRNSDDVLRVVRQQAEVMTTTARVDRNDDEHNDKADVAHKCGGAGGGAGGGVGVGVWFCQVDG